MILRVAYTATAAAGAVTIMVLLVLLLIAASSRFTSIINNTSPNRELSNNIRFDIEALLSNPSPSIHSKVSPPMLICPLPTLATPSCERVTSVVVKADMSHRWPENLWWAVTKTGSERLLFIKQYMFFLLQSYW